MRKTLLAASAALLLAAGPAAAQQKTIKIGFISTFSGPVAVIGNDMRNSFELALDHLGRKIGGLPVEVIYEDDGFKPEVGKQKTDKLIESDKVDFITGYIWSNVLLASLKSAVDSKTFLITANAGPSQLAGELCSPYVFSSSWNNDQTPQAVGMTNPRLLILDEATEGLAPLIRAEIWRCLASLKELGLSILVIDKNVGALLRVADRHFLIERGRVVWKGTSPELAAAPDVQHRYLGV